MQLAAPAKINLGLRIVGRRADGYHLLESLFLPLDPSGPLSDRVELELRDAPGVSLSVAGGGRDVPADARNLAWRAAAAFLERAATPRGVAIRLAKRVPSGAGLGGGSSDAGAVLRGLSALLPGAVSGDALQALALGLGADVPFFLDPRPAEVRGIGEEIAPAPGVPALPLIVVHPGVSLGTAEVYAGFAAAQGERNAVQPRHRFPAVPVAPRALSPEAWVERVRNDLEAAATELCPRIASLQTALREAGALAAGMSGSGAAVYGVFESTARRDRALDRLRVTAPERAYATESRPSDG